MGPLVKKNMQYTDLIQIMLIPQDVSPVASYIRKMGNCLILSQFTGLSSSVFPMLSDKGSGGFFQIGVSPNPSKQEIFPVCIWKPGN